MFKDYMKENERKHFDYKLFEMYIDIDICVFSGLSVLVTHVNFSHFKYNQLMVDDVVQKSKHKLSIFIRFYFIETHSFNVYFLQINSIKYVQFTRNKVNRIY